MDLEEVRKASGYGPGGLLAYIKALEARVKELEGVIAEVGCRAQEFLDGQDSPIIESIKEILKAVLERKP
jgi:hypothetical protein